MQLVRQEICVEWRTPREWRMQRLVAELARAGELERTSDPDVFKLAPTVDDGILDTLASLKMKGCTSVCIADIEAECKTKAIRCNKEQIGCVLDRLAKDGQIMHVPEKNSYLLF
jgi:hypothetical protein